MENITAAYTLLKQSLTQTTVFGIDWIIPTAALLLLLVLITRDVNRYKILTFPAAMLLHIIGLEQSTLLLIISGLVFVVEALSTQTIGHIWDTINNKKEKDIVRQELERARRTTIKNKIQKGITSVENLLNRDITDSIRRTKTGLPIIGNIETFRARMGNVGQQKGITKTARALYRDDVLRRKIEAEKTMTSYDRRDALIKKIAKTRNYNKGYQQGREKEYDKYQQNKQTTRDYLERISRATTIKQKNRLQQELKKKLDKNQSAWTPPKILKQPMEQVYGMFRYMERTPKHKAEIANIVKKATHKKGLPSIDELVEKKKKEKNWLFR